MSSVSQIYNVLLKLGIKPMLNDVMEGMEKEKNSLQTLRTLSSQFHTSGSESYFDLLELIKTIQNTNTLIYGDVKNKKIQREIRSLGLTFAKAFNRICDLLENYKLLD